MLRDARLFQQSMASRYFTKDIAISPTQRTLEWLRKRGIEADVCERWIPNPKHPAGGVRRDLFNFADLVAMDGGIVAIQCTADSGVSARCKKIKAEPRAVTWMQNGGQIWVIGWSKRKERVDGKLWKSRWVIASLVDGKIEFGYGLIRD